MPRSLLSVFPAAVLVLATAGVLPGCSSDATGPRIAASAVATIRDAAGAAIGTATLQEDDAGTVRLSVTVAGLTPGEHGIHVHAVGSCAASGATAFGAAGGHFNPHGKAHGLANAGGAHGGDLPNLVVGADGRGTFQATTDRLTLTAGAASLFDADGAAIVVHAGRDDQTSDPAGNSGARVACGVIAAQ